MVFFLTVNAATVVGALTAKYTQDKGSKARKVAKASLCPIRKLSPLPLPPKESLTVCRWHFLWAFLVWGGLFVCLLFHSVIVPNLTR